LSDWRAPRPNPVDRLTDPTAGRCPPLEEEEGGPIDAEALEQATLPRAAKRAADAAPADSGRAAAAGGEGGSGGGGEARGGRLRKKRRSRRSKPRYPKGFDPENPQKTPPPDPERWLPKRERSNYRPRKKDKNRIARGPQGSTSGAARVDDRATTNVKELSEEEKARNRAKAEAEARAEAAAAAASAASSKRSNKKKGGKGKW